MGNVIYCETEETTTPYVFRDTRIAVYSYEEVCYYIFHNPSIISLEVFGEEFLQWVEEQLHMKELADKLSSMHKEGTTLIEFLKVLLLEANYYSKNEVALLFERMKTEASLPKAIQLKKQADGFLDFHKYVRAIRIYDKILQEELEPEFCSTIYHNKGVALSKNFELKEAAECYRKAYEVYPNDVSLSCYLTVFFMLNQWEDAEDEAANLGVDLGTYHRILGEYKRLQDGYEETAWFEELVKAMEDRRYGREDKALKRLDKLIQDWKEDYRTQMV